MSADLTSFLAAGGRSLADAQGSLVGDVANVPTAMGIADAELEVKATMETGAGGAVALRPISSDALATGKIDPGALSTVRIRYVAVGGEEIAASAPPRRSREDVIGVVQAREDVIALARILGGLTFDAAFVPWAQRWLVTASDEHGRRVREVVLPDAER